MTLVQVSVDELTSAGVTVSVRVTLVQVSVDELTSAGVTVSV